MYLMFQIFYSPSVSNLVAFVNNFLINGRSENGVYRNVDEKVQLNGRSDEDVAFVNIIQ